MSGLRADQLANYVQAHYGRVVKERDWSLFLFFRILGDEEAKRLMASDSEHQRSILGAPGGNEKIAQLDRTEHVKVEQAAVKHNDLSMDAFAKVVEETAAPSRFLAFLNKLLGTGASETDAGMLDRLPKQFRLDPKSLSSDKMDPEKRANACFQDGLLGVCLHEYLRYAQGADRGGDYGLLRSEADQRKTPKPAQSAPGSGFPQSPVNVSFTFNGIKALKIAGKTAASFPEAFRQGMAARAQLIRDSGRSAPEHWHGALGTRSIHGLLTAHFPVSERGLRYWDQLRKDVEDFNDGDEKFRQALAVLFRTFGFEVLHIEFGQNPYEITGEPSAEEIRWPEYRLEHFGFRDGISQPFVDLGLSTPPPGGGRPAKDGTWAPIAPGEIYLGPPDEDELTADQPINADLRNGGTYLVFRKLEQDVAGYRAFLAKNRETPQEQERLAAQIVGRWPSGAPLVRHPDADASYRGAKAEKSINDFRYFTEDPHGRKCSIGSHIRRANPRDTGGGDEVKRHRILRRGMAYGGPLLPSGSLGDGRERGLLFVAANARIDLQFEVIQRDWINGGEFLGQAGVGRCPLTGTNEGNRRDQFLEAGAIAPVCGMPSFVFNRGGDYFFLPSKQALVRIARGEKFEPDSVPFGPYSGSAPETPGLLSEGRLKAYSTELFMSLMQRLRAMAGEAQSRPAEKGNPPRSAIRVRLPEELRTFGPPPAPVAGSSMVFVGHYDDVVEVLGGHLPDRCRADNGRPRGAYDFSVAHYLQAGREITRGEDLLIAMDPGGPFDAKRQRRLRIMRQAWDSQKGWTDFSNNVVRDFIRDTVDHIEHRVAQTGRMDLLQDLAFYIPYRLLEKFIGLPGPDRISELVVALPFAKRFITKLPADWLRGRQDQQVSEPDYVTTQMWGRLAFAEVIGNILDKRELTEVAIQATSEMLTYIDEKIMEERLREVDPSIQPSTLLEALVRQAGQFGASDEYFAEVRAILADLMTTISMNIALPFSKAVQAALAFRLELSKLVNFLDQQEPPPDGYSHVELLAYELLRLFPSAPAIFRRCEKTTTLPSGAVVEQGEWVAALLPVASRDPRFFPEPNKFSLGEHLGGPKRNPMAYLLFGPPCGVHRCWGEERLGRLVLAELLRATARFKGLSRVAGPNGEVVEFPPRMDYGLRVKFPPFNPNKQKQV